MPDATTLLKFRRRLKTYDLCQGLFKARNADLAARGLLLREGTLVDATLKFSAGGPGGWGLYRNARMAALRW